MPNYTIPGDYSGRARKPRTTPQPHTCGAKLSPADEALQIVTAIEPLGAALNHALASTPLPEGVRVKLNELTVTCSPAALRLIAAKNDCPVTTRLDPDTGAPSRLTALVTLEGLDLFMTAKLGGAE